VVVHLTTAVTICGSPRTTRLPLFQPLHVGTATRDVCHLQWFFYVPHWDGVGI